MAEEKKRGLALSGGGFRATLFHLGVIRYLYDLERVAPETKALSGITHITAVSGGSIIAAHLVLDWESYTRFDDDGEAFGRAAQQLVSFIKRDVRGRIVRRLPFLFPIYALSVFLRRTPLLDEDGTYKWARVSTTDLLQKHYSAKLFGHKKLIDLDTPSRDDADSTRPRPLLYLLTTTLDPPGQAAFTPDGFQATNANGVFNIYDTSTQDLGLAVAASSAFPGMFTSVNFRPDPNAAPFKLVDGGVYDNLGVRKFWGLIDDEKINISNVIVSDASVKFKPADRRTYLELLTTPLRAADILYKRVYEFETREARGNTNLGLQGESEKKEERFTFIRLQKALPKQDGAALIPAYQQALHFTRTDLDEFSDLEIAALVRHGYSVARAQLSNSLAKGFQITAAKIWNPVADSKDPLVREMLERKTDNAEKIKNRLEESAVRRYRFWSSRDVVSYLNGFVCVVIAGFLFLNPILGLLGLKNFWAGSDRSAEKLLKLPEKARLLRDNRRPSIDAELAAQNQHGESSKKRDLADALQHMETDAKVSYSLVKTGNVDSNKLAAATLERGFSPAIINEAKLGGFVIPAMPALWTLAALAALHQDKNLNSERKVKVKTRIEMITRHLFDKGYFDARTDQSDGLGVRILPTNADQTPTSAYTTALALLVSIEMSRANLDWYGRRPSEMTTHLLTWLNQNYRQNLHGWKFLDENQGNTIDAVNLQILALMLECRAQPGVAPPEEINPKVDNLMTALEEKLLSSTDARLLDAQSLLDIGASRKPPNMGYEEGYHTYGQMKVKLLWRPWAIRFCMLWLRTFSSSDEVSPEKKRLVIDLLDKLITELPEEDDLQSKAETLIALAEISTGRAQL